MVIKNKKKMVVDRKNVYLYEGEDGHEDHSKQKHPKGGRSSFILVSSRWRRFYGFVAMTRRTVERRPRGAIGSASSSLGDLLLEVFQLKGIEV